MAQWMKWMPISRPISKVILTGLLVSLASLSGCTGKPVAKLVIPDSRDLKPAVSCDWDYDRSGMPTNPHNCVYDGFRVNIDTGFLREILETLDACRSRESA